MVLNGIKPMHWKAFDFHTLFLISIYRVFFFYWSALKMTKCQTLRKFWHLELFWRDLHVIWHLVIFWADQLKKPPCMCFLCILFYLSLGEDILWVIAAALCRVLPLKAKSLETTTSIFTYLSQIGPSIQTQVFCKNTSNIHSCKSF